MTQRTQSDNDDITRVRRGAPARVCEGDAQGVPVQEEEKLGSDDDGDARADDTADSSTVNVTLGFVCFCPRLSVLLSKKYNRTDASLSSMMSRCLYSLYFRA